MGTVFRTTLHGSMGITYCLFRQFLNLAAKILIIIELHKLFDTFSVVCGDFVRLFVRNA